MRADDEQLERFRREVLPRLVAHYRPQRVLAFGSRVRGDALKDSDLDVLVVADAFGDTRWIDRPVRVAEACDVRLPVEFLCYTSEEYDRQAGGDARALDAGLSAQGGGHSRGASRVAAGAHRGAGAGDLPRCRRLT